MRLADNSKILDVGVGTSNTMPLDASVAVGDSSTSSGSVAPWSALGVADSSCVLDEARVSEADADTTLELMDEDGARVAESVAVTDPEVPLPVATAVRVGVARRESDGDIDRDETSLTETVELGNCECVSDNRVGLADAIVAESDADRPGV